jgi:hypothetical protein
MGVSSCPIEVERAQIQLEQREQEQQSQQRLLSRAAIPGVERPMT